MDNNYGIMPIGPHDTHMFSAYDDLAAEMVVSERGNRLYGDRYAPDEVYEYAMRMGRPIRDNEDLDELYEELLLRR